MPDIMTKEERSKRMSLIRGKWTKQERWLHNHLKGNKIKHRMHPKIKGSPDLVIPEVNLTIFLHGCFWHGCHRCYREPLSNKDFWREKITRNRKKDKKNTKLLRENGWLVLTIWEHEIKRHNPSPSVRKIIKKRIFR